MSSEDLYAFMSRHKLGVLSTIGPSGDPQSALMGIAVTTELEIIVDTVKSSRKYSNLTTSAACSFVIGCEGEQTVLYEGIAAELRGAELERRKTSYISVWPDGPSRESWPGIVYCVVRSTTCHLSRTDCRSGDTSVT
jgi:hypothetical protein